MKPLSHNQAHGQQVDSTSVGRAKAPCQREKGLALNITAEPEPTEVTLNSGTGSEPMGVSLNSRTGTICQADPTLRQPPELPDWLTRALSQFQTRAAVSKKDVTHGMNSITDGPLRSKINTTAVKKVRDATLRHIDRFTEQVRQRFAREGADNWQGCMDWLIRLPAEKFCCPELLALLPVELVRMRPDLPQNLLPPNNTALQLAAQSLLIGSSCMPASCERYLRSSVNGQEILEMYLQATSTLRYQLLEAVIQCAPPQSLRELLSHWLHDHDCEGIAEQLTANPLHPIMITRDEPLLQDLLTACTDRLLQPITQQPAPMQLAELDRATLDGLARCHNKVIFGRTLGGIGAAQKSGNLYLKFRRINEKHDCFMAEQAMLSWLHTQAPDLQLESCMVALCGTVTGLPLKTTLQRLNLNAAEKCALVHAIVYNKKPILDQNRVEECLARYTEPTQGRPWSSERFEPCRSNDPYYHPPLFFSDKPLFDFLMKLPFSPEKRAAFIDDLLPALDRSLRNAFVAQTSQAPSDALRWELLRATLPDGTLQTPVTLSLFSTPAGANYHQYVTDSEQGSSVSVPLSERPQVLALRSWLRDYGRLFQKGILAPPACNMFHNGSYSKPRAYHFLYRNAGWQCPRPGRIERFNGESTDYPNIGPQPLTLRDGGDAILACPGLNPTCDAAARTQALPKEGVYRPVAARDREFAIDSLANAWLGSLLLLGRILRTPANGAPHAWLENYSSEHTAALATLVGEMAADLFSRSFAVDRTVLQSRLYERGGARLFERCAREMQAWMTDDFADSVLAKEVPEWLYPDYTGEREGLFVDEIVELEVRRVKQQAIDCNHSTERHLGVTFSTTPLQGIEILTKKALAESILLAGASATCGPPKPSGTS